MNFTKNLKATALTAGLGFAGVSAIQADIYRADSAALSTAGITGVSEIIVSVPELSTSTATGFVSANDFTAPSTADVVQVEFDAGLNPSLSGPTVATFEKAAGLDGAGDLRVPLASGPINGHNIHGIADLVSIDLIPAFGNGADVTFTRLDAGDLTSNMSIAVTGEPGLTLDGVIGGNVASGTGSFDAKGMNSTTDGSVVFTDGASTHFAFNVRNPNEPYSSTVHKASATGAGAVTFDKQLLAGCDVGDPVVVFSGNLSGEANEASVNVSTETSISPDLWMSYGR